MSVDCLIALLYYDQVEARLNPIEAGGGRRGGGAAERRSGGIPRLQNTIRY